MLRIWKKKTAAYITVLCQNLPEGAEKSHVKDVLKLGAS
jgi:hypothetical protein